MATFLGDIQYSQNGDTYQPLIIAYSIDISIDIQDSHDRRSQSLIQPSLPQAATLDLVRACDRAFGSPWWKLPCGNLMVFNGISSYLMELYI